VRFIWRAYFDKNKLSLICWCFFYLLHEIRMNVGLKLNYCPWLSIPVRSWTWDHWDHWESLVSFVLHSLIVYFLPLTFQKHYVLFNEFYCTFFFKHQKSAASSSSRINKKYRFLEFFLWKLEETPRGSHTASDTLSPLLSHYRLKTTPPLTVGGAGGTENGSLFFFFFFKWLQHKVPERPLLPRGPGRRSPGWYHRERERARERESLNAAAGPAGRWWTTAGCCSGQVHPSLLLDTPPPPTQNMTLCSPLLPPPTTTLAVGPPGAPVVPRFRPLWEVGHPVSLYKCILTVTLWMM